VKIRTAIVSATTLAVAAGGGIGVGFALGQNGGGGSAPPTDERIELVNADLSLATDCDALLDSYIERGLDRVGPYGWDGGAIIMFDAQAGAERSATAGDASTSVTTSRSTSNESGTNVQELGVDESDVVKVAGSLLLRLQHGSLVAYDVSGDAPVELSRTPVPDSLGSWLGSPAGELLFIDGRAVVFGGSEDGRTSTITTIDLSDPTSPSIVDAVTIAGQLSAARMHGDVVRAVVRTPLPELDFRMPDGKLGDVSARLRNRALVRDTTLEDWLPTVDGEPIVDCADVAIPSSDDVELGTTTLLAFDPADPEARDTTAVATDSQTSYFSTDRFYLAGHAPTFGLMRDCLGSCTMPWIGDSNGTTPIFAFALDGKTATYVASGEVEGTIADRWSMDAVDGSLRVAVGASSETGNFNSVITLREDGAELVEEGRVDKLGVNEQIKSVRWFDDLAILVTFRQTDPLYAIDLSNPASPILLGELKIPGYSEYLHPLGEHRLIGIGQDASSDGMVRGAQAALFDVTDLTNPRQIDVVHYAKQTQAGAATDPRQFTWLPDQRTALTVVSQGWTGTTGWVSVLSLDDGSMTNRMVEVEHGSDVADVRLVPLASGKVALITGEDVEFFDVGS